MNRTSILEPKLPVTPNYNPYQGYAQRKSAIQAYEPTSPSATSGYSLYNIQESEPAYPEDAVPMMCNQVWIESPNAETIMSLQRSDAGVFKSSQPTPSPMVNPSILRQKVDITRKPTIEELRENVETDESNCICFCIPRRRKQRFWCLGITLIVLTALIVIGVLFFPQVPKMKVLNITLLDDINSFRITGLNEGFKNINVVIEMQMLISVVNYNRYYLKVEEINMDAFIMANITELNKGGSAVSVVGGSGPRRIFTDGDTQVLIGHGEKGAQIFPSQRNVTFLMDLTVSYTPDSTVQLKDDVVLNEIMQACAITQPNGRTMNVIQF